MEPKNVAFLVGSYNGPHYAGETAWEVTGPTSFRVILRNDEVAAASFSLIGLFKMVLDAVDKDAAARLLLMTITAAGMGHTSFVFEY